MYLLFTVIRLADQDRKWLDNEERSFTSKYRKVQKHYLKSILALTMLTGYTLGNLYEYVSITITLIVVVIIIIIIMKVLRHSKSSQRSFFIRW